MIELFFVACLTARPEVCTPHSMLFEARNGALTCLLQGQIQLARWAETHPGETVREWRCRRPGSEREA